MTRIPLINPKLVNVVAAKAEKTPAPVLRAEVVSSEPVKASSDQQSARRDNSLNNKGSSGNQTDSDSKTTERSASNKSTANVQHYKIVLKIGQQQIETISAENFHKGRQLDVKVMPGPELKIITSSNDKTQLPAQPTNQTPAQAALQQLLADRIPKIQSQGITKLIDQLGKLMSAATKPTTSSSTTNSTTSPQTTKTETLLASITTTDSSQPSKTEVNTQTTKQTLANLAYQTLAKQPSTIRQGENSTAPAPDIKAPPPAPLEQVKNWLQQLPSTHDISNSTGLRNALNNTGVRAETQLSQLTQQFLSLNTSAQNPSDTKSANSIFQQLQKIQQKVFSKTTKPPPKTDLASIVKDTGKHLEKGSQTLLDNLKTDALNTKAPAQGNVLPPIGLNASAPAPAANNWQNPLLNNTAYSTLNELLKDPLLQNPSSNNKFALSQILNQFNQQADPSMRIPLNWPERTGNDAVFLRTLQNLLSHIEREQGIQLQQSDSNATNNPNQTTAQNQQWLPLLIHHHQQLQLIEFFVDKEEKKNAQGEKKNHWFINLHFDLPQLGELGIEISMFENECNTTFWSESPSTLSRLSQHVQPLRERLSEQGIIVSDVQSRHGTLSKRKHNFEQRLVDIKT
jgi:hypothetical protein